MSSSTITSGAMSSSASGVPTAMARFIDDEPPFTGRKGYVRIMDLTLDGQRDWHVIGRVMSKSRARAWSFQNPHNKMFHILLNDQHGNMPVRCTFFGQRANKWVNKIELGKVYKMSKATVSDKPFSSTNNHPVELIVESNTTIDLVADDIIVAPLIYNLTKLDSIGSTKRVFVDVLGMCIEVIKIRYDAKPQPLREIVLVDSSDRPTRCAFLGDYFPTVGTMAGKVILLKAAKIIGMANDKYLSSSTSGDYIIDPDIDAAKDMKEWFKTSRYRPLRPIVARQ